MLCRYHIGGHYNWTVVSLGDGADRVFKTATAKTDPVCTKLYTSCYCRPACSSSFYFVLAVDLRKKEKNKKKKKFYKYKTYDSHSINCRRIKNKP